MSGFDCREGLVGLIADTHGVLPEAVHTVFSGAARILHAGDVGSEAVLAELESIAPVTVVRGNTDPPRLGTYALSHEVRIRLGELPVLVVHDVRSVLRSLDPELGVVVSGHTHRPAVRLDNGVWFVNPGSASASRTVDGRPTAGTLLPLAQPRIRIVALG